MRNGQLKMTLEGFEDFVRQKVEVEKCSHRELSSQLQQCFPDEKGFSLRSIERFCSEKEIKKVPAVIIIVALQYNCYIITTTVQLLYYYY